MKTSEDYYYRSYDADERYWRKCQILWEVRDCAIIIWRGGSKINRGA